MDRPGGTAPRGQPEVNLGILPCFGGTRRLPRLVRKVVSALELITECVKIFATDEKDEGMAAFLEKRATVF